MTPSLSGNAPIILSEPAGEIPVGTVDENDPDPPFDSGSTVKAQPETIAAVKRAAQREQTGSPS